MGLIGCGRFGAFCLECLRGWERIQPVAVADLAPSLAESAARTFGLAACAAPEEVLARDDLDLVLISTPPHTHHRLALEALGAGKHVICEKPLALTVPQADELIAAARSAGRLLAVNHMLRYSRLMEAAERIIRSRALGEPLHFFFENYAEDERLPADHWFWNPELSGGIFIEHGVHFFDLHRWWFGPGQVAASGFEKRRPAGPTDRAWCSVRHQGGVLGHYYHAFDQPVRLDRADHRVVFERGELTILGWIPVELLVTGIVNDDQREELVETCRSCQTELIERYQGPEQRCRGRGKDYLVTARVELRRRLAEAKSAIYGEMIRSLLDDQLRTLEEPDHQPRLRAEDAREAVAAAVEATRKGKDKG